jgi:hypothetical protein
MINKNLILLTSGLGNQIFFIRFDRDQNHISSIKVTIQVTLNSNYQKK